MAKMDDLHVKIRVTVVDANGEPVSWAKGGIIPDGNMALVGEAQGCDLMLPAGTQVFRKTGQCDGPGCEIAMERRPEHGCGTPGPAGWYTVQPMNYEHAGWVYRRFHSLHCMANWLAGELAKEESKQ